MEATVTPAYATRLGRCYHGDSLAVLPRLKAGSVQLVLTSPPFALRRRKVYGNVPAAEYVEWYMPFVEQIHRLLRPDGSLVFELAGAYEAGRATRSLFPYELIVRIGQLFRLCQEFYWHNPGKLPTPAQWVSIERTRAKDAVTPIWWFAKHERPAADNRRVTVPYSTSMRRLLKSGYRRQTSPSGHGHDSAYRKDNGGSIPPNLIQASNTRSNDPYLRRCKAKGLTPHPARFVPEVPEFFIKFLTEPGDLVLDPFAGSNTVGATAEALGRQWVSVEKEEEYVKGSKLRFR